MVVIVQICYFLYKLFVLILDPFKWCFLQICLLDKMPVFLLVALKKAVVVMLLFLHKSTQRTPCGVVYVNNVFL